ncbi:MAG: protein kinase [Chlamydiales bacterium]|nr:protein kinase [Chlamydiales bacterium]
MVTSSIQLEQRVVSWARNQISHMPAIMKVAKNTFADQDHSYTVQFETEEVKLFMNLHKNEKNAIAGSGQFKISKIMKKVGTCEVAVRSVLKHAKQITTEDLVFQRINQGTGPGKQYVRHSKVFAYTRKNGDTSVACVSSYCPHKFSDLKKEQKKVVMAAIAQGLEYLHENGIVHCDLHSKNILINNMGPVIIDLEGALIFDKTTGTLDADFLKRRLEKRPYYLQKCGPPDIRKVDKEAFDALKFDRAKKWDFFAFGLLLNDVYTLGILVETSGGNPTTSRFGYEETIGEIPDCDFHVYKAPSIVSEKDKPIVSIALKCLQGHPITWSEIHTSLTKVAHYL